MPLDRDALAAALAAGFQAGLDDPAWTGDMAAQAMADAIDAYVRGADVTGVTTQVVDPANARIGTGTQTGTGGLS